MSIHISLWESAFNSFHMYLGVWLSHGNSDFSVAASLVLWQVMVLEVTLMSLCGTAHPVLLNQAKWSPLSIRDPKLNPIFLSLLSFMQERNESLGQPPTQSHNVGYMLQHFFGAYIFSSQQETRNWEFSLDCTMLYVLGKGTMASKCDTFSYHFPCRSFWLCTGLGCRNLLTGF